MENEEHGPQQLLKWHVVEAGRRQAWPFLQLADPSSGREVRIYLDTDFAIHPRYSNLDQQQERAVTALEGLVGAAATHVDVVGGRLEIQFGAESLVVAHQANERTTHEPWWLSQVR